MSGHLLMGLFLKHILLSVGGVGVVVVVFCAVTYLSFSSIDAPHPSDQELEANFFKNEADFDALVRMAQADPKVVRLAPDFNWLDHTAAWPRPESEWGLSNERWDEYRKLFRKLGLPTGISNLQPDGVMLFASSRGLVTGGSTKGYAYFLEDPPHIVDSLERASFKDSRIAYKRLRGHWYLFYWVN